MNSNANGKIPGENIKKSSKQKRINAIDIFLIILLVASIVGISYRHYMKKAPVRSDKEASYEIYFTVKNVSFTLPSYLRPGDKIYFESGEDFGILLNNNDKEDGTALVTTPANIVITDENGNYVSVIYPDGSKVDANGSILAKCIKSDDGRYLLGGTGYITPGEKIKVRTELVNFELIVTNVAEYVE